MNVKSNVKACQAVLILDSCVSQLSKITSTFGLTLLAMGKKKVSIFDMTEFSFGRKFNLLGRLFHAQLSDKLQHIGIKKHFSILYLIDKMGDHCSQKFIADTLHIDKTLMVGALDELVEVGFIKRVQNPSDRREYWIQLTEKGQAQIPKIKETVAAMNDKAMAGLSEMEKKRLHKYLDIMYKNIESMT